MKQIIFFLFLFSLSFIYGQAKDDVVKVSFSVNGQDRSDMTPVLQYVVKGTPYLDKTFKLGKIIFNGKSETESLMRYNIYRDRFEVLDETNKQVFLAKNYSIEVILDNKRYQYLDFLERGEPKSGYFVQLSDGKTALYSKASKKVSKYDNPDHGYEPFSPPEFINELSYYIKRESIPAKKVELNKRDVPFVIEDKFTELRSHIKKNKLKLKTKEEVIALLEYYDSLE